METTFVQIGNRSDGVTGAVNPPVYLSTAYVHSGIGE
ncbi:cystathionine beta-lyase/cystathionine gamma-synthase [Bacillus capparidis]|uniref:Cystathionine beta-lyase/cystathionine gamma-synthase n=1 Tax=Bacillus capparidis TaxID=1840411 RepID=A0ABS4CWR6_9BACI|nr:cystathionine beta-lyase/cystathionine gamma-synthase [Bacillus capparidis]